MKKVFEFLFGVRVEGEKLPTLKPLNVREMNFSEYQQWCTEFNVGCRTDRTNLVHF
jgi:hypothetical protein